MWEFFFIIKRKAVLLDHVWDIENHISHKLHCLFPQRGCYPLRSRKFIQIFPRMSLLSHQLDLIEFILVAGHILCSCLKMYTVKMLTTFKLSQRCIFLFCFLRTPCWHLYIFIFVQFLFTHSSYITVSSWYKELKMYLLVY